jgi:hypothetical protein
MAVSIVLSAVVRTAMILKSYICGMPLNQEDVRDSLRDMLQKSIFRKMQRVDSDNAATTPVSAEVVEVMIPVLERANSETPPASMQKAGKSVASY